MRGASFYGSRERTQRDRLNDCVAFVCNAMPRALLAMTPERLCADKGLTDRTMRADVAAMLTKAQMRERSREA
jgi:hypothetical protein